MSRGVSATQGVSSSWKAPRPMALRVLEPQAEGSLLRNPESGTHGTGVPKGLWALSCLENQWCQSAGPGHQLSEMPGEHRPGSVDGRAPRTPPRAPPRLHPTPRALSAHPPPLGPVPTAPYLLGGLRAPEAEVGTLGVGGLVPLSPYPGPQGPPACSGNGTKAGGTPNPHCLREQGKEEPPRCPGPSRWYVSQPGCPLPSQAPALFPRLAASTAL